MGPTCFCAACWLYVRGLLRTVLSDTIHFRNQIASVELGRVVGSSYRRRFQWVAIRSLPTLPGLNGDHLRPRLHELPVSILGSGLFGHRPPLFHLDQFRHSATNPVISLTASKNILMNSVDSTTFYTVWSTKFSKAVDRKLRTSFWLLLSVTSLNFFIASSTCTGKPATASRKRSCSLVKGATGADLMFAARSLETIWSANTQRDAWRFGLSVVGKGAHLWALVPTRLVRGVLYRFWQYRRRRRLGF